MKDVTSAILKQLMAHLKIVFSPSVYGTLYPDFPLPEVTLDLPQNEPYPNHVFVWGTAKNFKAEQFVTGAYMSAAFDVWVTVVATSDTAEAASEIANSYQALIHQVCLCDPTLGGTAVDAEPPTIEEADAWFDSNGRRHAGYLLALNYTVHIGAADEIATALKG